MRALLTILYQQLKAALEALWAASKTGRPVSAVTKYCCT
jgi:hypothetical protein